MCVCVCACACVKLLLIIILLLLLLLVLLLLFLLLLHNKEFGPAFCPSPPLSLTGLLGRAAHSVTARDVDCAGVRVCVICARVYVRAFVRAGCIDRCI